MKSQVKFQREWFPHRRDEPPRREKQEPRREIHTATLDVPSLTAALKTLNWSVTDLAKAAKLSEEHIRNVVAGKVFNAASTRAIQDAINNAALAPRR